MSSGTVILVGSVAVLLLVSVMIGGLLGLVWMRPRVTRQAAARSYPRWADLMAEMGFRLAGIASSETGGVPGWAASPGPVGVGHVGSRRRRASVLFSSGYVYVRGADYHPGPADQAGPSPAPETWVSVHLGRSIDVGVSNGRSVIQARNLGSPASFRETLLAIERDPDVASVLRRFDGVAWEPAIVDRSVVARWPGHCLDPEHLRHALGVLDELADAVLVARARMTPTEGDRSGRCSSAASDIASRPSAVWHVMQNAFDDESGRGAPARTGPSGKSIASRTESVPAGMLPRCAPWSRR